MYNNKAIRRVVRAGRRSTIGNRVTGYNLFEGSNPLLSAKNEKAVPQGMAFLFFICKGFKQGGSRLACGRKQSCGLFLPTRSRSIATRRHTAVCRKIPCSLHSHIAKFCLFFVLIFNQMHQQLSGNICQCNFSVHLVFVL